MPKYKLLNIKVKLKVKTSCYHKNYTITRESEETQFRVKTVNSRALSLQNVQKGINQRGKLKGLKRARDSNSHATPLQRPTRFPMPHT